MLIGNYGNLVEVKDPSGISPSPAPRSTYQVTNKGRRVEFRGPRGHRDWSVDIATALPSEIAGLAALVDGFFGPPPWVFIEPWAVTTNLLSPAAAILDDGTWEGSGASLGGAGTTSDGVRFGRSVIVQAGGFALLGYLNFQADYLPVLPGEPVTASIYATGTGYVRIDFVDGNGAYISTVNGASGSGLWTRRTLTIPADQVPANAGGAQIRIVATTQLTLSLPAATWTMTVQPWAHGAGCNRVSVDGLPQAVQSAVRGDLSMQRASTSFTVKELGY